MDHSTTDLSDSPIPGDRLVPASTAPVQPGRLTTRLNAAVLVASDDLRLSANQVCRPALQQMEEQLTSAFERAGMKVVTMPER